MEGFVNSPDAVKGLEFYKELYKCCTPPGTTNAYMTEGLDAFKSGQVAMQMNFFAFFPGIYKDPNVGGDKIGFFVNPDGRTSTSRSSAARASRSSPTPTSKDDALEYIKWFAQPAVQKKWWALGGYSCLQGGAERPGFLTSAPFAHDFLDRWRSSRTSGPSPPMPQLLLAMQKRVHDYVVADKGTAKEALDGWSRTGPRSSRKKARSSPRSGSVVGCPGARPPSGRGAPAHPTTPERHSAPMTEASSMPATGRACRQGDAADRWPRRVRGLSDRAIAWLFIAPTIALLLAINIFPLLWTIRLSFTNYRANRPNAPIVNGSGCATTTRVLTDPDIWAQHAGRRRTSCSGRSRSRRCSASRWPV